MFNIHVSCPCVHYSRSVLRIQTLKGYTRRRHIAKSAQRPGRQATDLDSRGQGNPPKLRQHHWPAGMRARVRSSDSYPRERPSCLRLRVDVGALV